MNEFLSVGDVGRLLGIRPAQVRDLYYKRNLRPSERDTSATLVYFHGASSPRWLDASHNETKSGSWNCIFP